MSKYLRMNVISIRYQEPKYFLGENQINVFILVYHRVIIKICKTKMKIGKI